MNKITNICLGVCVVLIMKSSFVFGMMDDDMIERPIRVAIPEVACGYEEVYERFLKGKLIYKPQEGSDVGRIDLPIAALANPLEGTFDLSKCGDAGNYFSISTGYRKQKIAKNESKVEIWFAPRFLIEKELKTTASHFKGVLDSWNTGAPVGIFWTWGGWDLLEYFDYLTTQGMDELGSENLHQKWVRSLNTITWGGDTSFMSKNFMFIL